MMLFNPLFLQSESGSESLFITKPGTLKKKGYLFADIMKVYFNNSGESNALNSKLNLTASKKSAGDANQSEQTTNMASLLANNKIISTNNNGSTDAAQTNELIASIPTVKVSLSKLENILGKLLGKSGDSQTNDLGKLIKQLIAELNSKGEIVLSVEQNGEKVVVDVSKAELIGNENTGQVGKTSGGLKNKGHDTQNYAIKIVAVPKNFNLLSLSQKINKAVSGEINISEVNKISVPVSGKKGNRVITVFSIDAQKNNTTEKTLDIANTGMGKKSVIPEVQNGSETDVAKSAIFKQNSSGKPIPDSSLSLNLKAGTKNGTSKNISTQDPAANTTNSALGKSAAAISASNGTAEIIGDNLAKKNKVISGSNKVVKTAGEKGILKSEIISNTNGKKTVAKKQDPTEIITDVKPKIVVQKKSKTVSTKTTTEAVKGPAVKTGKGEITVEPQKAAATKPVEVIKEAVKSTKAQIGTEKIIGAKKATVTAEKIKNISKHINQKGKTELSSTTTKGTSVHKSNLNGTKNVNINNSVAFENQTVEGASVISSQVKKVQQLSDKINQDNKEKKGAKDSGSSTGNVNKLKSENNSVQQKESKQHNNSQQSETNTKDNFANGTETDAKGKSVKFNMHNIENSNIKGHSIHEFSAIFERSEKTVRTSEIIKEFSQFIKKKGKTQLVLQLDPAKLGKVKITLDVAKDIIQAHIEVETNAAKQTVQNNLHELYSQLNQSGINLGTVSIALHEGGNKEAKQFSNKRKHNNSFNSKEEFGEEEENTTTRKLGYNTYEFLA